MSPEDTTLYSDFYRCKRCKYVTFSILPSLLIGARCSGCRLSTGFSRIEVIEVLSLLRTIVIQEVVEEKKIVLPLVVVGEGLILPPVLF